MPDLSSFLVILVSYANAEGSSTIKVGAAKVDITPDSQVYIAGYGQDRPSTGVHDPVWARCMVLEIGGVRIAFLTLDLIGLFLDEVDVIRKGSASGQLTAENVIVSCTHNHEGPDTLGLWGPSPGVSGFDDQYRLILREKAVQCVLDAESNLRPAILRIGQTQVRGAAKNARDRDVLDLTLVALKAEELDGTPICTLINFANHPEALGSRNTLISCDWPHYAYEYVEDKLGGICLLQNGALGGMVTPDVTAPTFEEAQRIGNTTGEATVECLRDSQLMECENITHVSTQVRIPLDNQNFLALREAGVIKRSFQGGKVSTELHLIRFGDVEMVTIPGEALPKVGLTIKEKMNAQYKVLIGLGNDELGYIIPKKDFDRSKYEESMSVGPNAAPIIERGLANLIEGKGRSGSVFVLLASGLVALGSFTALGLMRRGR